MGSECYSRKVFLFWIEEMYIGNIFIKYYVGKGCF